MVVCVYFDCIVVFVLSGSVGLVFLKYFEGGCYVVIVCRLMKVVLVLVWYYLYFVWLGVVGLYFCF